MLMLEQRQLAWVIDNPLKMEIGTISSLSGETISMLPWKVTETFSTQRKQLDV